MSVSSSLAKRELAGLPGPYWVLWVGTLINRLGTMVQPFLAFYLTGTRGMSLAHTGVVMTVFGVGALFSQLISGWLSDRIGRRVTLASGMLATSVSVLTLAYSTSLGMLAFSVFALGLAIDVYRPASNTLVADLVPVRSRARAFGFLFWAINLGFTAGVLTGGTLAETAFMWLFWIDAITCAVFGVLVLLLVPEPNQVKQNKKQEGSLGDVFRDRAMVGFAFVTLGYFFVYLQSQIGLPLAMEKAGLPPSAFGTAIAVNGVLIVIVQPLVVGRLARMDLGKVAAVGIALAGLGFGATTFATSTAMFVFSVIIWTGGEIVTTVVSATIASNMAPPHLRGRYNGLYGFAWSLAGLLAPTLGTRLLSVNSAALWLTCAAVCGAAALGQFALAPEIRRRTEAAARAQERDEQQPVPEKSPA
ncbi:MDR family MFS transporter [Actinopolyspora mortivallis]|uniref:MDR family MFS transporter n=1 Tax=Actinopolyspora mortivallis TaxID=33906 RepID=UPI000685273D|nr:MFS transporter [Actinopolyspora mortivallis]